MENSVSRETPKKRAFTTKQLSFTALMAVLIIVCSWISVPTPWGIVFTLQTFAVFFALVLLGGRCGTFSVLTFLLLGAVGLPVFSQFRGGISALFGLTGGYMLGFLFTTVIYWLAELIPAQGKAQIVRNIAALLVGLAVCYLFGTLWFMHVYTAGGNSVTFGAALMMCVVPYVAFDLLKLAAAVLLGERLRKLINK
ncbi:MAG: biotin transporter BioY [Ruminococcus sp.]|nr:biotin transporter BioY [Ruminococcus sp.]